MDSVTYQVLMELSSDEKYEQALTEVNGIEGVQDLVTDASARTIRFTLVQAY